MSKNKFKETNSNRRVLLQVIRIILIVIIIYCLIYIFLWWKENKDSSNMLNQVTESAVIDTTYVKIPLDDEPISDNPSEESNQISIPVYELDFSKLLATNASTVGWLTVPGTNINYPVAQAEDNDFYLAHSFDKSKNKAGWIFADCRNNFDGFDRNIIIYGHNRLDSSMFATLKNTQTSNWYNNKSNHYISFTTQTGVDIYQVFSVYTVKSETYYLTTSFTDNNDFLNFVTTLKNRSLYNFGVNLTSEDSILTLSTCDSTGKSRVILHAKKINI